MIDLCHLDRIGLELEVEDMSGVDGMSSSKVVRVIAAVTVSSVHVVHPIVHHGNS